MFELARHYGPGSWDWIDDSMIEPGTGGVEGHAATLAVVVEKARSMEQRGSDGFESPPGGVRNEAAARQAGIKPSPVPLQATDEDIARFFKYVDKLPNGCWFWTGARSRGKGNRKWYGSFRLNGTVVRAHRFSAEVLGGKEPLPSGHHRDHTCVFSLCVCPDHVEYVTREENQKRKMARKG